MITPNRNVFYVTFLDDINDAKAKAVMSVFTEILAKLPIPVKIATHSGANVATRSGLKVAAHSRAMLPPCSRSEATLAVKT